MPLHRQTADLLALLGSLGLPAIEDTTPEQARAQRAAMLRPSPEPIAEVRDVDAGGVPARFYRPAVTRTAGLLVWFHGGGWVLGDLDSHDDPCRSMANRGGFCVLSVGYRLAPEHRFPAAVDDAITATRWASEHARELGCAAIAVGGDSAGGNLAAVVANDPPAPICFQLLVYPATDTRMVHPSHEENAEGYFLTAAGIRWFLGHYLAGDERALEDPRMSPLLADPARLAAAPRRWSSRPSTTRCVTKVRPTPNALADAGVATSHVRFDGQIHGFFSMFELIDDARSAQALAAEAVHSAFVSRMSAVNEAISAAVRRRELDRSLEHGIEHRLGEPPSERVLLARVVGAQQRRSTRDGDLDAVAELRPRPQAVVPGDRGVSEPAEAHDHRWVERVQLAARNGAQASRSAGVGALSGGAHFTGAVIQALRSSRPSPRRRMSAGWPGRRGTSPGSASRRCGRR